MTASALSDMFIPPIKEIGHPSDESTVNGGAFLCDSFYIILQKRAKQQTEECILHESTEKEI